MKHFSILVALVVLALLAPLGTARAANFQVVAAFTNFISTGASNAIQGPLVQGSDGNFYGYSGNGGSSRQGSFFMVTPAGTLTSLHQFTSNPAIYGSIVGGGDGYFYGTTHVGGTHSNGTVFQMSSDGTVFNTLYSFAGGTNDGASPYAGLVQGLDSNFYGTTAGGGLHGHGTVFRIDSSGNYKQLYSFGNHASDGREPVAPLVQGSDGNFYGTTEFGETVESGTVFQVTSQGTLTTLANVFANSGENLGGLVESANCTFFGLIASGGADGDGSVYSINTNMTFNLVHSFSGSDGRVPGENTVGEALVRGGDGNFYGTTAIGGTEGYGNIFKISEYGMVTTLYSFTNGLDGEVPTTGLVEDSNGDFYGTTIGRGKNGEGTVFKISCADQCHPCNCGIACYIIGGVIGAETGGIADAVLFGTVLGILGNPNPSCAAFVPAPGAPTYQIEHIYVAQNNTLPTEITDFPINYPGPFTISVNGITLGQFSPGDSLVFSNYAAQLGNLITNGIGVHQFTISGLGYSPDAGFPLELGVKAFNTNDLTYSLEVTGGGSFTQWQYTKFTSNEFFNPAISGPMASPSSNGIPNLMSYALFLEPKSNSIAGLPVVTTTNGHLRISYTQNNTATDLTYTVQVSTNLAGPWSSGTNLVQLISVTTNTITPTLTIVQQDLTPVTALTKRFMRLQVTSY